MKVYLGHSRSFDFQNELYKPLCESKVNVQYEFILPHEISDAPYNSLEKIKEFGAMIAEVSFPSTGLGIEIGWASAAHVPLLFLAKDGCKVSNALVVVAPVHVYKDEAEMMQLITAFLVRIPN